MTRVFCTKKLKEFIGNGAESLPSDYNEIQLSDWNAHLFFVDKRKCIVFVNILTYYSVFITDIVKKDFKNIDEIFEKRLKEQLLHDHVVDNFENAKFLIDGSKLNFYKTNNNKKVIGRINDFVQVFKDHCCIKYGNLNDMPIIHENGLFNVNLTGKYYDTKKTYSTPVANLKEEIKGKG